MQEAKPFDKEAFLFHQLCTERRDVNSKNDDDETEYTSGGVTGDKKEGGGNLLYDSYAPKGAVKSCMCEECETIYLESKTYAPYKAPESSSPDDDEEEQGGRRHVGGYNTDSSEEEENTENLPYVAGKAIVTARNITDISSKAGCLMKRAPYVRQEAVLSMNKLKAVVRVFADIADITDNVKNISLMFAGEKTVVTYDIHRSYIGRQLRFEVVEDYEEEAQYAIRKVAGNYHSVKSNSDYGVIWAVDSSSNKLVEIDRHSLEILKTHNVTIPNGTVWDVAPVNDIIIVRGTDVDIYNPILERTHTVANACRDDVEYMMFAKDGWLDIREEVKYLYDEERGNPVMDKESWWYLYNVARPIHCYHIFFNVTDDNTVLSVPTHIPDIELARTQYTWLSIVPRGFDRYKNTNFRPIRNYYVLNGAAMRIRGMKYLGWTTAFYQHQTLERYDADKIRNFPFSGDNVPDMETGIVDASLFELDIFDSVTNSTELTVIKDKNALRFVAINYSARKSGFYDLDVRLTSTPDDRFIFGYSDKGENWREPILQQKDGELPVFPAGKIYVDNLDEWLVYIGEDLFLRKVNIFTGEVFTLRKIAEQDEIKAQFIDGEANVVYHTATDIKRVEPYVPDRFNVASAIKRYVEFMGLSAVVEEAVYSYITGFIINSDFSTVMKNLHFMTGVTAHRAYGDGVLYLSKAESVNAEDITPNFAKDIRITKPSSLRPPVALSYVPVNGGTREEHLLEGEGTYVKIKTNAECLSAIPLAYNTQTLSSTGSTEIKYIASFQKFLLSPPPMEARLNLVEASCESTSKELPREVLYPPTNVEPVPIDKWKISVPRPVVSLYNYPDISALALGWFDDDGLFNTWNFSGFIGDDFMINLRHHEWWNVRDVEEVAPNKYNIISMRKSHRSPYVSEFEGDNKKGMWVIHNTIHPLEGKYLENRFAKQQGIDVVLPESNMLQAFSPAPINPRIVEYKGRRTLMFQPAKTAPGEFLVITYHTDRDKHDARYLFNSLQRQGLPNVEDFKSPFNKHLNIYHVVNDNKVNLTNDGDCWRKLRYDDMSLLFFDVTNREENTNFSNCRVASYAKVPKWFPHGQWLPRTVPMPAQPPNNYLRNDWWREMFDRFSRRFVDDWRLEWDYLEDMLRNDEWPDLLRLDRDTMYIITRDRVGHLGLNILDVGIDSEAPDELAGYKVTHYTTIRYILETIVFKDRWVYQRWDDAKFRSHVHEYIFDHGCYWYDLPDYPYTYREFHERCEVLLHILDQYFFGKEVPENRVFLLEKYGFGPPITVNDSYQYGAALNAFFKETFTTYSPFKNIENVERVNLLIAQRDTHNKWGHFAIYEDVEVEKLEKETQVINPYCSKTEESIGCKAQQPVAYYVFDSSQPLLYFFSVTHVYGPEHEMGPRLAGNNVFGQVVLKKKDKTELKATVGYACIKSQKPRIQDTVGYYVISP
jgi:hypothetical protein